MTSPAVNLAPHPSSGAASLRRRRAHHLESFYEGLLHPRDERHPLAPKTVYEMPLVIRGALDEAVRRGLLSRNVALVAHAPRLRSIPKVEQKAWTADELQSFLRAAAGHRLFPALWVGASPSTPTSTSCRACRPKRRASSNSSSRRARRRRSRRRPERSAGGTRPDPGRSAPSTTKAQVSDLGLQSSNGGGGRI